jgi:hypothetical protein
MPTYTLEIECLVASHHTVQVDGASTEDACRAAADGDAWCGANPAIVAIAQGALWSPYQGDLLPVPAPYAATTNHTCNAEVIRMPNDTLLHDAEFLTLTLADARDLVGATGHPELDHALDRAQGRVFAGDTTRAFVVVEITG